MLPGQLVIHCNTKLIDPGGTPVPLFLFYVLRCSMTLSFCLSSPPDLRPRSATVSGPRATDCCTSVLNLRFFTCLAALLLSERLQVVKIRTAWQSVALWTGGRELFLRISCGHSTVAVLWTWKGFTGPDIYGLNMQRGFFRIAKENFPDRLKLFSSEYV